jgi:hypothetical protein
MRTKYNCSDQDNKMVRAFSIIGEKGMHIEHLWERRKEKDH